MPDTDPAQTTADPLDELNLVNAGYVADLYERYRADPTSVEPEWRSLFDKQGAGTPAAQPEAPTPANGDQQAPPAEAAPAQTEAAPEAPSVPEGATPIKGPAARTLPDFDGAAVVDDRALDEREAEPGPPAPRRVERDEDVLALLRGDARSVVVDFDLHRGGRPASDHADRQASLRVLADVRRVLEEIPEDSHQEPLVSRHDPELARDFDGDARRSRGRGRPDERFEIVRAR